MLNVFFRLFCIPKKDQKNKGSFFRSETGFDVFQKRKKIIVIFLNGPIIISIFHFH